MHRNQLLNSVCLCWALVLGSITHTVAQDEAEFRDFQDFAQAEVVVAEAGAVAPAVMALPLAVAQGGDAVQLKDAYLERVREREIGMLVKICHLSPEQDKAIRALGKDLKAKVGKPQNVNAGLANVFFQFEIAGGEQANLQPSTVVRFQEELQKKFLSELTPEQQTVYQKEIDDRRRFKQKATAECLVALIDEKVSLNPEQVEPLTESLMKWEAANDFQLSFYFQNNQNYFIPMPTQYYDKILDDDQMKVIRSLQQVQVPRQLHDADDNGPFQW